MPRFIKQFRIPLIIAIAMVLAVLVSPQKNQRPTNLANIKIPLNYTQPLIIETFDLGLSFKPQGARAAAREELGENKFRYIDAYQNTDVVQTRFSNKLKEDIILKQPGHPAEFSYNLGDLSNYKLKQDKYGNLNFYNIDAFRNNYELSKAFTIPAPYLVDAQGNKSSPQEVEMMLDGSIFTLIPSKEWLESHAYPIILDPTVEINILNVHSHPQQGDNWTVSFTTQGRADLRIIPDDQATIDEDEFVSLSCDGQVLSAQILTADVVYYPDWQCNGIGQVVHYTLKAGKHTLRFEFGGEVAYAYNDPADSWWDSNWNYRQEIIFDNTAQSTGLVNFPAVATTSAVNTDFWNNVKDDAGDLRFVDDEGVELYFELEQWDSTADDMAAWIKVPFVHATVTDSIYMYYSNSGASTSTYATTTGVWDSNFVMVQHLQETTTGNTDFKDSTTNNNDSSLVTLDGAGSNPDASGQDDGAVQFDGSNDIIQVADANSLDITSSITISVWINGDSFPSGSDEARIIQKGAGIFSGSLYSLAVEDSKTLFTIHDDYNNRATGAITLLAGSWYYLVGRYDGSTIKVFVNGSEDGTFSYSGTGTANAYTVHLARRTDTTSEDQFDGIMDEVRISNIARSADWISFGYCNMLGSCNTYGSQESVPAPSNSTPTITSVTDSPDPTCSGCAITFSTDWNDADAGDLVKVKICKTDSLTNQVCDGGAYASSTVFTVDDPEDLIYNTAAADEGANNYWIFVCDDSAACSASTAGSFTVGVSGTSGIKIKSGTFKINRADPTLLLVSIVTPIISRKRYGNKS